MKKVLFVSYGGGHVNALAPIYKLLKDIDSISVDYLACTTAMVKLEKSNLDYFTYLNCVESLYKETERKEILGYGEKLSLSMKNGMLPERETIAYLGVNFYELVKKHGLKKAELLYLKLNRKAFLPVDFSRRVLKSKSYDLIVSTTSPRSEEAFYRVAYELGIEALCLMDLFSPDFVTGSLASAWHASYICCPKGFSRSVRNLLSKSVEVNEFNNPAFDYLSNLNHNREGILNDWNKRNVVFIKSPTGIFDELEILALKKLINLSKKQQFDLLVRHHPNDESRLKQSTDYIICDEEEMATIIKYGNVFVTVVSTVGVEASLVNKSVIQIYDENTIVGVDFEEQKIGARCHINSNEFDEILEEKLNLEKQELRNQGPYEPTAPKLRDYILSIINKG